MIPSHEFKTLRCISVELIMFVLMTSRVDELNRLTHAIQHFW